MPLQMAHYCSMRLREVGVHLQQEKAKRQKYQDIRDTHRELLHPFISSTDCMLAPEATKILQHLAHITADKQ
jgi:hypothetical protein